MGKRSEERKAEFNRFYKENYAWSYRYLCGRGVAVEEAADLLQHVFLRSWERFDEYLSGDNQYWLFNILRNHANYHFRQRGRTPVIPGFDLDAAADRLAGSEAAVEDVVIEKDELRRFYQEVYELPDLERDIILLRLEGFAYKEIADKLKIGAEAARSRSRRAVQKLAPKLLTLLAGDKKNKEAGGS